MTEIPEAPAHTVDRRIFARWDIESKRIHSPILSYGFAIVSVAVALGLALVVQYYQFSDVELRQRILVQALLFTLSIALTTWYAGNGPSALSVVLAIL
jgi:hypothetical protein